MAKVQASTVTPEEGQREARDDAYTGMLGISLLALVAGCVLLFLDLQRYDYPRTPPRPKVTVPAPPQPPGQPPANPPAANPGGGQQANPPAQQQQNP